MARLVSSFVLAGSICAACGTDAAPSEMTAAGAAPRAWAFERSPSTTAEPSEVSLSGLDGSGTLAGDAVRVVNCVKDTTGATCRLEPKARADAGGDYLDFRPPAEHGFEAPDALDDSFAEVNVYYQLTRAHD